MPIIQYEPNQVQQQVVAGPKARSAPAAAFGGDVASGLADVAKATFDMKNRIDTTTAEEALVKFERDKNDTFFNPDTGYFNTQGRNAYDNSVATTKKLEELKINYGESLNPQSKAMFDRVADNHIMKSNVDIARHASKGLKAWEISTIEAQIENSLENASFRWDNPEELGVQRVLGRQAVIDSSDMMGDGPEAKAEKLQTFESAFAGSTITAATANSAAEGQAALDKYGSKLESPDKFKIENMIEKKAKVEKTQADATAATLTANRLVNQYDSKNQIIDEVKKIKDPELQKKTMTESMTQYDRKVQADKELELENYKLGIDHFNGRGTAGEFQAQNAAAWEGMSPTQRNNLLSGKYTITDQIEFNSVMTLPRSQLAEVNPNDYADVFAPADVSKLRSAVDKAKKGQSVTSVQTASQKTNLIAEQFFGKKSTWKGNKDKSAKVQGLMTAVQGDIEEAEEIKGGKLTPTEVDTVLADFSRRFVVERSAFGFDFLAFDTDIDLSNTSPEQVSELSKFVNKHGEASFQEVTDMLESKDKPITIDTILSTYRQATK